MNSRTVTLWKTREGERVGGTGGPNAELSIPDIGHFHSQALLGKLGRSETAPVS